MKIHSIVTAAAAGSALIATSTLSAQVAEQPGPGKGARWELHVPSGTMVPTGDQRDAIKRGNVTAAQLMYVARPGLAVTSSFGWARSRDIATIGSPKLDAFTYDVGAELRAPSWIAGKTVTFTPFAGAGGGGRSYNYRKLDVDATHNLAAYGSVGGELGVRRVRVRVEARDYVTGFRPLAGQGASRTGNDVVVMAGVRLLSR